MSDGELIAARRRYRIESNKLRTWMAEMGAKGELVTAGQAPTWPNYEDAKRNWKEVLERLDAMIDAGEGQCDPRGDHRG